MTKRRIEAVSTTAIDLATEPSAIKPKGTHVKRFLAGCILCTGLVGLVGCGQTGTEPVAKTPATETEDRQEAMKPVVDESSDRSTSEQPTRDQTPTDAEAPDSPTAADDGVEGGTPDS